MTELNARDIVLSKMPKTLEELKSMPEAEMHDPNEVAALAVAVLNTFSENSEECYKMFDYLKGPTPLTPMGKQFIRDRLMDDKTYILRSYYKGATPANSYTPTEPWTLHTFETPISNDMPSHKKIYIYSGGSEIPRYILLRHKASTDEWFIVEQYILVGIIQPANKNPWA